MKYQNLLLSFSLAAAVSFGTALCAQAKLTPEQQAKAAAEAKAKALIKNGKSDEAWKTLGELSQESCLCIMNAASELADEIFKTVSEEGGIYGPRKELLTDYFERVKITF